MFISLFSRVYLRRTRKKSEFPTSDITLRERFLPLGRLSARRKEKRVEWGGKWQQKNIFWAAGHQAQKDDFLTHISRELFSPSRMMCDVMDPLPKSGDPSKYFDLLEASRRSVERARKALSPRERLIP
jgi:hypothetical protein